MFFISYFQGALTSRKPERPKGFTAVEYSTPRFSHPIEPSQSFRITVDGTKTLQSTRPLSFGYRRP